ncbi:Ribose import ATP-binding protein RbsA [uncultured Roseburia sp.]|uniref:Sugar ABC transporter ATP-binding protein n=1 Tax=Brotonthovivens ammoniilytica TaxID=2981725 RepID=A0ABT2TN83_9FIRM|nr:sugar ABC transporter ATP-binding protein [Brotonthovivens ammoniilytica]MCU6763656.1 sugar ABC transporter ATP-binding protein [Brotonthovivens ammoniilytica]SCJ29613.1 Ribose import ATP-binding protein RbsA [uncultured Roseburia sp.]
MEAVLEMKKITKRFPGVVALDQVSLTVHRGEIHALIGENGAGKSTLMKCLLGIYQKDEGEIIYKGRETAFKSPHDALNAGISMIHQELNLVQTFTVAENIWMGREGKFAKAGVIDTGLMNRKTKELLERLNISVDPSAYVSSLSVANMQLIELARAVSYDADIIVMDEPTSALADQEILLLHGIVRDLVKKGTAVIFISHKLEELFEICDNMTIMRNGQFVATKSCREITMDQLIGLIAGREIDDVYIKDQFEKGKVKIRVENLCGDGFSNVSFEVRAGEILGLCGLMGAGRSEIMRAIFGIDPIRSGKIYINDQEIKITSPKDAIAQGIAMVTEDRLRMGILQSMSISTNITLPRIKEYARAGFMNSRKELWDCEQISEKLHVKKASFSDPIASLSGGNQQKVILARWLLNNPEILILDEPTRGIDVGAKSEIYKIMNDLARNEGLAILMVSSEMPEILGMSDTIAVVRNGQIVHMEENREGLSADDLLQYAFGVSEERVKTGQKCLNYKACDE